MFGSRPRPVGVLAGSYTHRLDRVDPDNAFTVCGIVAERTDHRLRTASPSDVDCPYCRGETSWLESFAGLSAAPR